MTHEWVSDDCDDNGLFLYCVFLDLSYRYPYTLEFVADIGPVLSKENPGRLCWLVIVQFTDYNTSNTVVTCDSQFDLLADAKAWAEQQFLALVPDEVRALQTF